MYQLVAIGKPDLAIDRVYLAYPEDAANLTTTRWREVPDYNSAMSSAGLYCLVDITNRGTARAAASSTGLFEVNEDKSEVPLTRGGQPIGQAALAAGTSVRVPQLLPPLAAGRHHLEWRLDTRNVLDEWDETNNSRYTEFTLVNPLPITYATSKESWGKKYAILLRAYP
ncbi:MAG: CARDB domain-containing protein [Candidatus Latescibacterota bacterium]